MQQQSHRFVIAGFLLFFNLFYGANFAAVAPILTLIIEDYDISRAEASLLVSAVIVIQAVLIVPGGMLVARCPIRPIFGLGWLMAGAMVMAVLADHFLFLIFLRLIFGLAFVLIMPATASIIMRCFSHREIPLINSLTMTFFTLGIGMGTFTAAPISLWVGWQTTISIFGGVLMVGAFGWMLFARIPPAPDQSKTKVSLKQMWGLIHSKTIVLLGLGDGAAFAHYVALTTWLPTYYNEVLGMSITKAGSTVGLIPITGVFAALVGGVLSSRMGVRRPFFVIPGLMVGFAGFGSFAFDNQPIIYVSMVALGITSFLYLPALLTVPMEIEGATEGNVAIAWATIFAIASTLAVISPIAVGLMTDSLGSYIPSFAVWSVVAWGLLIAGLMLPETGPKVRLLTQPGLDGDA